MAGGIVPGLIREDALQDKEFFTLRVSVPGKGAVGCVTHNAGRARNLSTDPVQHDPVNPRLRRMHPLDLIAGDGCSLVKLRVDSHVLRPTLW